MQLADFLRKQAEQVLELARKAADFELRKELTETARTCLAELNELEMKRSRPERLE
jgi:hypothetical protein